MALRDLIGQAHEAVGISLEKAGCRYVRFRESPSSLITNTTRTELLVHLGPQESLEGLSLSVDYPSRTDRGGIIPAPERAHAFSYIPSPFHTSTNFYAHGTPYVHGSNPGTRSYDIQWIASGPIVIYGQLQRKENDRLSLERCGDARFNELRSLLGLPPQEEGLKFGRIPVAKILNAVEYADLQGIRSDCELHGRGGKRFTLAYNILFEPRVEGEGPDRRVVPPGIVGTGTRSVHLEVRRKGGSLSRKDVERFEKFLMDYPSLDFPRTYEIPRQRS